MFDQVLQSSGYKSEVKVWGFTPYMPIQTNTDPCCTQRRYPCENTHTHTDTHTHTHTHTQTHTCPYRPTLTPAVHSGDVPVSTHTHTRTHTTTPAHHTPQTQH